MATDNSPPRIRLIMVMAFGTVGTLFVLKFVFDSYFTFMFEGEAKAKIAAPAELAKLHEEETKKLTGSPIPIDKAMGELASKGRESSTLIAPQPSQDDGPLTGWSQGLRAKAAAKAGEGAANDAPKKADAATPPSTTSAQVGDAGATPQKTAEAADAGHPH
ncbi:hypothetical protein LVJ94_09250 [Pendulispora rubella]|uniref:Uncharacterized protein n=1 Tax=Pendulispora rubella TaxID=2741070 RepID=A0ABZ2L903_9BACT